jgi:CheY-like chemotaxis protein
LDEDQVLVSLEKLKKQNGDRPLKRLLVVDDDPNIPDMVRQLLEESSYQVESASDGQEAWERIQKDRPDAILLDLMMPKMDGFALIDRLNQDAQYADLPVIVLTAKLLSKKERDSLNDSVGRVIQKQGLAGEALLNEIRSSIRETI